MPDLVTKTIGVKEVPTNSLEPNPHNPRLLFDREPMDTLKGSIDKVGILVPLTVYRDSHKGHFVILDGQRRWTCAMALGLPKIPVNEVAEPTLVQNIVTIVEQFYGEEELWLGLVDLLKAVQAKLKEADRRF